MTVVEDRPASETARPPHEPRSRKEDEAFPIRPAMVRPEGFHGSHNLEARSPPSPHLTMSRAVGPTIAVKRTVDRKSTRLNSSHANISYAVFCLKKKKKTN